MILGYFLRGLLIGLVFGVPAGAIGALTIQRTLEKGFFAGLITGAGSSAADLIYSCFTAAILNPAKILSFMVAFTAFEIGGALNTYQGIALTTGILVGTLCWWAALSGIVSHFRKRVTDHINEWLDRIL